MKWTAGTSVYQGGTGRAELEQPKLGAGTRDFRQRAGIGLGLAEWDECGLWVCCGDEDF